MARPIDKQIFWVILLAAVFWTGVWNHAAVADLWHKVSTRGVSALFR
jgi:hypothetical protein